MTRWGRSPLDHLTVRSVAIDGASCVTRIDGVTQKVTLDQYEAKTRLARKQIAPPRPVSSHIAADRYFESDKDLRL
jgi:hypothetical protein